MVDTPQSVIEAASARARARDLPGALTLIAEGLRRHPDAPPLLELQGFIAANTADHALAADAYGRLLAADPANMVARVNLATALTAAARHAEAAAVAEGHSHPKLDRIRAYLQQQSGTADASAEWARIVADDPDDAQSLNNLGNALRAEGRLNEAIAAFDRAVQLRPDMLPLYLNYAAALAEAERFEGRRQLMRQAADYAPDDAQVQLELGLAEAARGDTARAEDALRRAIALEKGFTRAFVELGLLLENLNRVDDLAALIEEARRRAPDAPEIAFLDAWLLRRRGRLDEALTTAERVPATIHPLRTHHLVADLADRLGDTERAFAEFTAMNQVALSVQRAGVGPSYREQLAAIAANLTDDRVASWRGRRIPGDAPSSPIFIVGFPRSGTTLLDTLLMNVPGVRVLEELPALAQAAEALGPDEGRLATLDDAAAAAMRADYHAQVERLSPGAGAGILVDKHPLHMTRVGTIHRLFPDATIVLVERHPYDAVLSCFMANFQLNAAMRSFTDLTEAARTYDAAFTIWERGRALFPRLRTATVRYERLVTDIEAELRPLLGTLELAWTPAVADNQGSAARRERVRTASYAQITEPVYQRAVARWTRYGRHLAPVLPILAPWAERMGYPT